MSERKPTPEQRAAIDAEGRILVSASAGSGKTFVMIEKIISLILSGRAKTSSVLAVTFTNLGAAEMKERLKKALVSRIRSETDAEKRRFLKAHGLWPSFYRREAQSESAGILALSPCKMEKIPV